MIGSTQAIVGEQHARPPARVDLDAVLTLVRMAKDAKAIEAMVDTIRREYEAIEAVSKVQAAEREALDLARVDHHRAKAEAEQAVSLLADARAQAESTLVAADARIVAALESERVAKDAAAAGIADLDARRKDLEAREAAVRTSLGQLETARNCIAKMETDLVEAKRAAEAVKSEYEQKLAAFRAQISSLA